MTYHEGDLIWLEATNIASRRPSKKLDHRRLGPFVVQGKVGSSSYRLQLPDASTHHAVFNQDLLRPFQPGTFPNQIATPPPPPDIVDGEEEWEVDSILDSQFSRQQLQYLVHWKGYNISEDTWEPARHLTHTKELVSNFHSNYPNKPKLLATILEWTWLFTTDERTRGN